jgi:capsular polysaccharide transport system ATP-binding protein
MIEIKNLTKSYVTKKGRHYLFKNLSIVFPEKKNIGFLGRNGAGKSTLLRILGGLERQDSGKVITDRRISWPVGQSSFQPSLTGRENVRFVAQIYGYSRENVKDRVNYVRDFAEIGDYFDMPVKTYSSGMKSRLAFGLSMAFDFDYFLIDEAFSAGDPAFKQKCKTVMDDKGKNCNFLIVSHSMKPIQEMCDMVLILDKGQVQIFENVNEGIAAYKKL